MLAGLVLLLAILWGRTRSVWYWLDESFTVSIASRSVVDIPELLRQDGAPPLFYVLLHFWMKVTGSAEVQTHLLSLVFALATIPAALWAGWSLFGRRTGWMFAVLVALSPYVASYATETRMYSLMILLSTLAIATFLHGFVFRSRGYIPAFAVLLAALLYTHNWALLFAVGAAVGVVICLVVSAERGPLLLDAALAFGTACLAYLPWLPTLLYQRAHTAAPFLPQVTPALVKDDLFRLVGGKEALAVIGLGALPALVILVRRPLNHQALAVAAAAAVPVLVVAAGWATSRNNSVWAFRYLAVIVPPILLVAAVGFARGGPVALAALGVLALLNVPVADSGPLWQKSNARTITERFRPVMEVGDLVVADYSYLPLLSRYLPGGTDYMSIAGPVADVSIADQRDTTERHHQNDPATFLPPLIESLPVGGHVLFVCPPDGRLTYDMTEFTRLVFHRCGQVKALLANDSRLQLGTLIEAAPEAKYAAVEAYLFTKQAR